MIGFASKGYSYYANRIGFETACENPPPPKNGFEVEINFQEIEKHKIRTNQRLRCEMRVEKRNRLRSGYECCCCCCSAAAARCV